MPLESWKTELIDQYGLNGTKLVGDTYSYATVKERMLAAILATDNNVRGDGLLTLCQQLEAMKEQLRIVLARGRCKNISRQEVHGLVDEIFDEYELHENR